MAVNPLVTINVDKLISDITTPADWLNLVKERYLNICDRKEEWQHVYEILKSRADAGDIAAIECIYLLGGYSSSNLWTRFGITTDSTTKYLAILPANKLDKIVDRYPQLFIEYITKIAVPMNSKLVCLEKEISTLQNQVKYMPGGVGYNEAKLEFNALSGNNDS